MKKASHRSKKTKKNNSKKQPLLSRLVWLLRRMYVPQLLVGVCIVVCNYLFVNAVKFPFFDNVDSVRWFEVITGIKSELTFNEDENVYINVAYDKQLAAAISPEWGDTIGTIDVTDRAKLLQMVRILKNSNYKYLFLDINFPKFAVTPLDSALYAELSMLKNCVISTHIENDTYQLADSCLLNQTAFADLYETYNPQNEAFG